MTCPLCDEQADFRWYLDSSGEEWAECTLCGGQTDQAEIEANNREDLPVLVPVQRRVQLPAVPEWESTRIDISFDSPHPGRPDSDWLRDLVAGVFEHADRVEIESWSFPEETAA